MNNLSLDSAIKTEIRNSVLAGKVVTAHESPVAYAGGAFTGYIILDPETGAGAYKIGSGENGGLLTGVDFIISLLGLFYGVLNAVAAHAGPAVPFLNKVTQYLTIAKFVSTLLRAGVNCPNALDAVLFFITLSTVVSLLITQLVLGLTNPLAAFAVTVGLDVAFSSLVSVSRNCSD